MKKSLTVTISALAFLHGCERVNDPSDVPFVERLVVWGELFESRQAGLVVERTVPVSQQFSSVDARLTDVTGEIVSDGVSHAIVHQSNGVYFCDLYPVFRVSAGQSFTMYLDWHGKRVTASTTMPYPAHIDTINTAVVSSVYPWVVSFDCVVTARPSEAYAVSWSMKVDSNYIAGGDFPLVRGQDAGSDGKLHFANRVSLGSYRVDSLKCYIASYDMPYYDFFASQGNMSFEHVPLITYFSGPVRWNVKGDGVGLFVARNFVTKTVRF